MLPRTRMSCLLPVVFPSINPSQLWIRMQFAPELEALQAFNWFPDEVLVVLVVVNENEKNCSFNSIKLQVSTCTSSAAKPAKRAEVYFLVRVVVMKKAFRSEELFGRGDDEAGSRRPGRLTGPPGLGQSPIAAAAGAPWHWPGQASTSSGGRCDSDYKY